MNKLLLFLLTPLALLALNGPTIAPTGHELYLRMQSISGQPDGTDYVTINGVSGGRFDGRMGTSSTTANNPLLNFWCVDAQLYFNWDTTYRANSLGFEEINNESGSGNNWAGGSRDVRYEDLPSATDGFAHGLGISLDANETQAGFRYRMAAYLLDQYELRSSSLGTTTLLASSDTGSGKYDPKNSERNQAILKAIWTTMDTTGDAPAQAAPSGNVLTWINAARDFVGSGTNYSSSMWNKWAIVSGWSGSTYVQNAGGPVQTFLTERTPPPNIPDNPVPEPGFYGLLATGVSGLFWFATRHKKNLES